MRLLQGRRPGGEERKVSSRFGTETDVKVD